MCTVPAIRKSGQSLAVILRIHHNSITRTVASETWKWSFNRTPPRATKEGNVSSNDAFNTFYLWLYGIRHRANEGKKGNVLFNKTLNTRHRVNEEMMHSTHFIYGYMASDIG